MLEKQRVTKETNITVKLDINGSGKADISTGIGFFEETTGAKRTFRATEKRPLQKSDQPKKMPLPGKLFINFRQLTQAAFTVFNCI